MDPGSAAHHAAKRRRAAQHPGNVKCYLPALLRPHQIRKPLEQIMRVARAEKSGSCHFDGYFGQHLASKELTRDLLSTDDLAAYISRSDYAFHKKIDGFIKGGRGLECRLFLGLLRDDAHIDVGVLQFFRRVSRAIAAIFTQLKQAPTILVACVGL